MTPILLRSKIEKECYVLHIAFSLARTAS
jgi:hypothetical protein